MDGGVSVWTTRALSCFGEGYGQRERRGLDDALTPVAIDCPKRGREMSDGGVQVPRAGASRSR